MGDKVEKWLDEIKLSQVKNEEIQQALANPLEYGELDLQARSMPDNVYSDLPTYNEVNSLTTIGDNQLEFSINSPHPIKLNSVYFSVQLQVDTGIVAATDANTVMPIADFFASLFGCISVLIGQNSCNIDHLDTNADYFHYFLRRIFTDEQYSNYMGYLEGLFPDTPNKYDLKAGKIDPDNTGGNTRYNVLFEKLSGTTGKACVRGIYVPANLFFQQDKILAPYVPLRIILRKNPVTVSLKKTNALTPVINWTSVKLCYTSVKLRHGAFDSIRTQYEANKTRFPALEIPENPYINPQALYQFLDVRAQKLPIPSGTDFVQTLRSNSSMPKAILFALAPYRKTDQRNNHYYFPLDKLKSYSILVNSQPIKSCSVDQVNCSVQFQDMYMRLRNFLGANLTNDCNGLSYPDFAGGAGIIGELTNNASSLYIPARQDIANIEIKLSFTEAVSGYELIIFLIYDQIMIIDKEFNARLITSV